MRGCWRETLIVTLGIVAVLCTLMVIALTNVGNGDRHTYLLQRARVDACRSIVDGAVRASCIELVSK